MNDVEKMEVRWGLEDEAALCGVGVVVAFFLALWLGYHLCLRFLDGLIWLLRFLQV